MTILENLNQPNYASQMHNAPPCLEYHDRAPSCFEVPNYRSLICPTGSFASAGIWRQGLGGSVAPAGIGRKCCLSRHWKTVLPQQGLGCSVASAGTGRLCCFRKDWESVLPQQGLRGSVTSAGIWRQGLGGMQLSTATIYNLSIHRKIAKCSEVQQS